MAVVETLLVKLSKPVQGSSKFESDMLPELYLYSSRIVMGCSRVSFTFIVIWFVLRMFTQCSFCRLVTRELLGVFSCSMAGYFMQQFDWC